MGVPKNYQQTVNLNKRVEALNDLTFYTFDYKVKLNKKVINEAYDNNKSLEDLEQFLGEIKNVDGGLAHCKNRVSALNREIAEEKLGEWLNKSIGNNIIDEYKINSVEERSFVEELDEKNLTNLLNIKRD